MDWDGTRVGLVLVGVVASLVCGTPGEPLGDKSVALGGGRRRPVRFLDRPFGFSKASIESGSNSKGSSSAKFDTKDNALALECAEWV